MRIALNEEGYQRAACKRHKKPFQEDRSMVRVAAVACWWRCCVGQVVSVHPLLVLPDRCRRLLLGPPAVLPGHMLRVLIRLLLRLHCRLAEVGGADSVPRSQQPEDSLRFFLLLLLLKMMLST